MEARSNVVGTMDYKISPNYAWVVALGAFLTQVLLVLSLSILAINLGEISLDWGIDEGTLGILSSCMGLTYGLFGFFWGYLMDRIGSRWTVTAASFVIALAIIAFGVFADGTAIGCVIMAVMGVGVAGTDTAVLPKLGADWFAPSKRGLAMGVFASGGGIGGFVVGIIAGQLAQDFGWRFSFIGIGLVCLVMAILVALLIRNTPASMGTVPFGSPKGTKVAPVPEKEGQRKANGKIIVAALKNPVTYKYGAVMSLWYFWYMVYTAYFEVSLQGAGFDVATAAMAYSLVCLSSALSNFIWSPLTDKFGRKSVFIFVMACEGLVMIALFLLLRTGSLDTALVYVMSFLMGLFVASTPIMESSLGEHYTPEMRGTGAGVVSTISCIGRFFGPLLAGVVITATGNVQTSLVFAGVSALVTALSIVVFVKKTGGKYGDPLAVAALKQVEASDGEGDLQLSDS